MTPTRLFWYLCEWLEDPSELLKQGPLHQDYLRPFEGVIRGVGDDVILRQVLIWAILHYVPFRQFQPGRLHVIFYEDVVRSSEQELSRLFRWPRARTPNGVIVLSGHAGGVGRIPVFSPLHGFPSASSRSRTTSPCVVCLPMESSG